MPRQALGTALAAYCMVAFLFVCFGALVLAMVLS